MSTKTRQQVSHDISMEELITKICKQQADEIYKKIDAKLDKLDISLKSVFEDAKAINEKVRMLEEKLNREEQYRKVNNVIVYGIKEDANENSESIEEKVLLLLKNKLEITVLPAEVDKCYRIGQRKPNKNRGILVHFLSYKTKTTVYNSKKLLKKSGFVIKEDLTKTNLNLVKAAINIYGLTNVWTQDGRVFTVKDGNKTIINNKDDLNDPSATS